MKSTKDPAKLSCRLERELRTRLLAAAVRRRVPVSVLVVEALEAYLAVKSKP